MSEESAKLDAIAYIMEGHSRLNQTAELLQKKGRLSDEDIRAMFSGAVESIAALGIVLTSMVAGPMPPEYLFWLEERKKSE